ncbi:MAG: CYTH domain-containing protein [Deltaproteobacteria bacterium]|nr:CYTH domain-containing protein [Deltaproteobacteria bacterium]
MPNEIELKLLIAPADIPRLQRHPLLKALTQRKLPTQRLLSIYYDTPELTLHRHRIAVRLRRVGRQWLQTVKTAGRVVAGLHERLECEYPATKGVLDFTPLTDPALQSFFADAALRRALQPVFVTEFSRACRLLSWPNGDTVEFALDRGEIHTGDRRQPISEVELELKAGASERLFALAAALQATIPLQPSDISKAERGYRLMTLPSTGATAAPRGSDS